MTFRKNLVSTILIGGAMAISGQASAHWSSGPFLYNDAGTNPMHLANSNLALGVANNGTGANAVGTFGTSTDTGTSYGTYTQTRTTGGDYGWIQGQDNTLWGNSHDNKGLAFSLGSAARVSFTITTLGTAASAIQTGAVGTPTNVTGATPLLGLDWNPAFSLFKGLATQSSHEGGIGNASLSSHLPGYVSWGPYATAEPYTTATDATYEATTSLAYTGSGTWGAYRSNADWTSGRDIAASATFGNGSLIGTDTTIGGENTRTLTYLGQADSGTAHTVTASFDLAPGDYSIWVGGNNAADAAAQAQNYQSLLAAHTANDATVAAQSAAYVSAMGSDTILAAAQATKDAVFASHTANATDRQIALDALNVALNNNPTAKTAYNSWQAALLPITTLNDSIATLRGAYGFTVATTVSSVPVPGAVWLFGSALAGLIGYGRRKTALVA